MIGAYITPYFEQVAALVNINGRIETLEQNLHGIFWPIANALVSMTSLLSGVKLDAAQQGYHLNSKEFPLEAVNWLENNLLPGRMFNSFRWGGYLLYRMWPNRLVFMDGQTDFYRERLTPSTIKYWKHKMVGRMWWTNTTSSG